MNDQGMREFIEQHSAKLSASMCDEDAKRPLEDPAIAALASGLEGGAGMSGSGYGIAASKVYESQWLSVAKARRSDILLMFEREIAREYSYRCPFNFVDEFDQWFEWKRREHLNGERTGDIIMSMIKDDPRRWERSRRPLFRFIANEFAGVMDQRTTIMTSTV